MSAEPEIDPPVRIAVAARKLKRTSKTIRQWIHDGAPCVRKGNPGPGNGALVRIGALRRWLRDRAAPGQDESSARVLQIVGKALLETLRADAGNGAPAPVEVDVSEGRAAALLFHAYVRMFRHLADREATDADLPEQVVQLRRIAENECRAQIERRRTNSIR